LSYGRLLRHKGATDPGPTRAFLTRSRQAANMRPGDSEYLVVARSKSMATSGPKNAGNRPGQVRLFPWPHTAKASGARRSAGRYTSSGSGKTLKLPLATTFASLLTFTRCVNHWLQVYLRNPLPSRMSAIAPARRERNFVRRSGSLRAMRQTMGRPARSRPTSPSRRNFFRGRVKSVSIECRNSCRFADTDSINACAFSIAHLPVL